MTQVQTRREQAGMMREDLARRCGIHIKTLRKIEDGISQRYQPRIRKAIARVLRANPNELFDSNGGVL